MLALVLFGLTGTGLVWRSYEAARQQEQTLVDAEKKAAEAKKAQGVTSSLVDTSDWKTYRNDLLELSVKYPSTFRVNNTQTEDGCVVSFQEFDKDAKDLGGQSVPGYYDVISICHWNDINDSYLKGGSWAGEKKYKDFQEFLADSEHTNITLDGEMDINGTKAYILGMSGDIGYEAIMFEHNGGYYRIAFPWTQKLIDEGIKNGFVSSIRFLK